PAGAPADAGWASFAGALAQRPFPCTSVAEHVTGSGAGAPLSAFSTHLAVRASGPSAFTLLITPPAAVHATVVRCALPWVQASSCARRLANPAAITSDPSKPIAPSTLHATPSSRTPSASSVPI